MVGKMSDLYYFGQDGSFHLLDDEPMLVYTDKWTIADWIEIENCLDSERQFVVRGIASKYASN